MIEGLVSVCAKKRNRDMSELGKKLLARRQEKRLNVKEVARQIGVSESTYRDWENGRKIQGEPYLKISETLDISLSALMGVEKDTAANVLDEVKAIEEHVKRLRKHVLSLF